MWFLPLVFFVTSIPTLRSLEENYYWREFTGQIPPDAIRGGTDINNKPVFIGQVYFQGEGVVVVEIFPGRREVFAPMGGVSKKLETRIKILCGHQANFLWFPANSTHLHIQLIDKKPVIGGHERDGVLYIGRISYEGAAKIGKIAAFVTGDAKMFYDINGVERGVRVYEVLLYEKYYNGLDVRED